LLFSHYEAKTLVYDCDLIFENGALLVLFNQSNGPSQKRQYPRLSTPWVSQLRNGLIFLKRFNHRNALPFNIFVGGQTYFPMGTLTFVYSPKLGF